MASVSPLRTARVTLSDEYAVESLAATDDDVPIMVPPRVSRITKVTGFPNDTATLAATDALAVYVVAVLTVTPGKSSISKNDEAADWVTAQAEPLTTAARDIEACTPLHPAAEVAQDGFEIKLAVKLGTIVH